MNVTRTLSALALAATACLPGQAQAAGAYGEVTDYAFSFEGPFGTYDELQLQRGFQIYQNVCSGCHGLKFVSFRDLGAETGPNFPEEQVEAIAEYYFCTDKDPDIGDRECRPSDKFPANEIAGAPDLSLMAKARAGFHGPYGLGINQFFRGMGGPEYITSLLLGYNGEEKEEAGAFLYYNEVFGWISMGPPLYEGAVEYELFDETGNVIEGNTPAPTMEQMAQDVSAFLMWAAEPKLVERKQAGLRNILMLAVLAVLLYFTNKKLWAPIKREE